MECQKFIKVALFVLFMSFLSACCATQDQPNNQRNNQGQRGQRPSAAQMIADMDDDKDGKLSKEEARGPLERDFNRIDSNGDGFLSKEELENFSRPDRNNRPRKKERDDRGSRRGGGN